MRRLLVLAVAGGTLAFAASSINADKVEGGKAVAGNVGALSRAASPTVIVYPVGDLPVWTSPEGGTKREFDPSVLIALIKASVHSDTWSGKIDRVVPHEATTALIVVATKADHKQVADLLTQLRGPADGEEDQRLSEYRTAEPDRVLDVLRTQLSRGNGPGSSNILLPHVRQRLRTDSTSLIIETTDD